MKAFQPLLAFQNREPFSIKIHPRPFNRKTVRVQAHAGSNPALPANQSLHILAEALTAYGIRTRGHLASLRGRLATRGGLRRSAGRILHSPPRQNNTMRSSVAAGGVRLTDGVVFSNCGYISADTNVIIESGSLHIQVSAKFL